MDYNSETKKFDINEDPVLKTYEEATGVPPRVVELEFNNMDKFLKAKLDLMVNRMTGKKKFDNLVLIDGDEGYGKSNIEAYIGAYVSAKTGRPLTLANVFFDLDKLLEFAMHTEEQIILWDEGALGGLANEWWNKNQKKFLKLLMVARKRRHFWVICIPKFFKLNEYLVIDRSIGLIHVYAKDELEIGRFAYFGKKRKEQLYHDWRKSKNRSYGKFSNFRGKFPEALPKIFNEVEYDRKKDIAIMSMDKEEDKKTPDQIRKETGKRIIENLMKKGVKFSQKELAEQFGVHINTIQNYTREIRNTQAPSPPSINNNGLGDNPGLGKEGEPNEKPGRVI